MRLLHSSLFSAACLLTCLSIGCKGGTFGGSPSGSGGTTGTTVTDDLKDVAKQTQKAAQDIGHATADLADKAGQHLEDIKAHAGTDSQDAWITTKVKSALTSEGLDPLHVHVDTNNKVVTLSGAVPSAAQRDKAINAAKAVTEVASVTDHLFVKADGR